MGNDVMAEIINFVREIFAGFNSGILFFGGPIDIFRYVIDILLIAFLIYNMIRILRETRAWQLLKGVLLIVIVAMFCSLLGLEMVGFIFNKILYIVALAFVVIFQPELRRALETVGLRSFTSFTNAFSSEYQDPQHQLSRMIDQVVDACVKMAKAYTGALIIFERESKLGELLDQENAVKLDSSVTDTMLQSIFYKGSPLHDGAILIRNGRIAAARCHIPLADNYHIREDLGTRHRAAIGASEMGDAISIAVSEERGTISIALDGCLYIMQNGEDLRSNLQYLLGVTGVSNKFGQRMKSRNSKWFRKNFSSTKPASGNTDETDSTDSQFPPKEMSGKAVICSVPQKEYVISPTGENRDLPVAARLASAKALRMNHLQKIFLFLLSLLISVGLWMYIQITSNPIAEKSFTIPIVSQNAGILENRNLSAIYPVSSVTVNIVGRKNTMDSFTEADIKAYIDYSSITTTGVAELPIDISSDNSEYFRVTSQSKESIKVNVFNPNG